MVRFSDLIISEEMGSMAEQEVILQPLKIAKIEECWWDVFAQEIFPRLPASQLQTIKIVCKNWFRTITSPNFVRLHLKLYNESRIRVIIERTLEMLIIDCDEEFKMQSIDYPPAILGKGFDILGSCDGLLCFFIGGAKNVARTIGVYNPSTGKYFKVQLNPLIQDFPMLYNCSWFGQHPCSSGEYVLVLGKFGCKVGAYKFSSTSNLEPIHSTSCCIDPQDSLNSGEVIGTLCHGAVHWPATKWNGDYDDPDPSSYIICAYHVESNKYLEISPPVQCYFKLGVNQGCLFAILKPTTNAEFEMWIMKEYGVQQSWAKYANILGFSSYGWMSPMGFFPSGDIILDGGNCMLIKYSFNDKKHVLLMNHGFGVPFMCADSLVSPAIAEGGVE